MEEKILKFENRFDLLGNIYESPELLSMEPEEIYRKLGKSVQNLQTKNTPKAAEKATSSENLIRGNGSGNFGSSNLRNTGLVDIYYGVQDTANSTPGWGYVLRSGVKSKKDNGIFKKAGNYAYYEVAALARLKSELDRLGAPYEVLLMERQVNYS